MAHDVREKKVKKVDRIRFPIAAKLIVIISILVVVSLGAITLLVTWLVSEDLRVTAETNNLTVNSQAALSTEKELTSIRANAFLLLDMLNTAESGSSFARQVSSFYFERNQNVAAIFVGDSSLPTGIDRELLSTKFFLSNEIDSSLTRDFLSSAKEAIGRAQAGLADIVNATPIFDMPMLVLLYPYRDKGVEQSLIIFLSAEELSDSFGNGALQTNFLVAQDGSLLVHPQFELVRGGVNVSDSPLFQDMQKQGDTSRQILFNDKDGKSFFGAYTRLSLGGAAVLTMAEADIIYEPIVQTTKRNILLTIAVLALSVLFIWFFSKSISKPAKDLVIAANQIEQGEFELNLVPRTHDELGLLTRSFVSMGKGLAERERLKDSFGRFINTEIAERAMRGELALGGENKETTIFFSDIRSFTAISEKLLPSEVVEFLNEYMTYMVDCVNLTKGVVDKFIGDAIMAVWGAPVTAGSPKEDAINCVRAAMRMRAALIIFNRGRGGDKKPIIRIGCGINSGSVVAGQIGSDKRMEYTVIGDAVNLASRTESLNKPMGTDILITEYTYNLVKEHVLVEEMPSVTVKGKEKPLRMFAVVNMPNEADIPGAGEKGPQTLNQVRKVLGIPIPDFAKVNLDEDEKKYKIQS